MSITSISRYAITLCILLLFTTAKQRASVDISKPKTNHDEGHKSPPMQTKNLLRKFNVIVEIGKNDIKSGLESLLSPKLPLTKELIEKKFVAESNNSRRGCRGYNLIHAASVHGNTSLLKEILRLDDFPKLINMKWQGWTSLHYAAYAGHHEVVSMLLKVSGITLNARTDERATPLILAAYAASKEPKKIEVYKKTFNVFKKYNDDQKNQSKRMKILQVNAKDKYNKTAYDYYSTLHQNNRKEPILHYLIDNKQQEASQNLSMITTSSSGKNTQSLTISGDNDQKIVRSNATTFSDNESDMSIHGRKTKSTIQLVHQQSSTKKNDTDHNTNLENKQNNNAIQKNINLNDHKPYTFYRNLLGVITIVLVYIVLPYYVWKVVWQKVSKSDYLPTFTTV